MIQQHTFLGKSPAVLSMLFEILHAQGHESAQAIIVPNIDTASAEESGFAVEGIPYEIVSSGRWKPSPDQQLHLGVNLVKTKIAVFEDFKKKFGIEESDYSPLIHPNSEIASTVHLGDGTVINPGVVIAPYSRLEAMVSVNRSASIGHHSSIGSFSTIHPAVNIAGHCTIGRGVTIGIGSNIVDGVSIGEGSKIGAGSLVTSDLPPGVLAYGVPAKKVRDLS